MNVASDVTYRVAKTMAQRNPSNVRAFDPMSILALLGILFEAIKLIKGCYSDPKQARNVLARPSLIRARRLRKLVDALPKYIDRSEAEYALKTIGANLTEAEVVELYREQDGANQDTMGAAAKFMASK